jgi:dipeptidyl aminopeptidase/acylaminoacyl peptidase
LLILTAQGEQPKGIAVVVFVPYYKYSIQFHLQGLPPLCLLHGKDDELVPFQQSVELDQELTDRGMPHEFHAYEGLSHYFSTNADSATTQQMFQDSLTCLRRWLSRD